MLVLALLAHFQLRLNLKGDIGESDLSHIGRGFDFVQHGSLTSAAKILLSWTSINL